MKKLNLAAVSALALAGLTAIAVSAQTYVDPYPTGATGYDVSYPNACNAQGPGTFGIVGVNGGKPFTFNSKFAPSATCAGQYATAAGTGSASVYINTAYSGAYKRNIVPPCSTSVPSTVPNTYAQAWEIGCSEAETSFNHFAISPAPKMWWLDVETANSWSSSNFSLNDYALQGAADTLHSLSGGPVGIYSTSGAWYTITRNANFASIVDGEWDAGSGACPASGTAGFTGAPIWLEQGGTGGIDTDQAC